MGGSREQETDGGIVSPCTHQPYHSDGKKDLEKRHNDDDGDGGEGCDDDDVDVGGDGCDDDSDGYGGFEGKG